MRVIKTIYFKSCAMEIETAQCHISETLMDHNFLKFRVEA